MRRSKTLTRMRHIARPSATVPTRMRRSLLARCAWLAILSPAFKARSKRSRQLDAERTASLKTEVERAQIASVRQHLSRRDLALERMSKHLAAAIGEYGAALKAITKANRASPKAPPPGSTFMLGKLELDRRVLNELYRLSAPLTERDVLHAEHLVFPGAAPDNLRNANQPGAIQPLADAAREATTGFCTFIGAGPAAPDDYQVAQDFDTEDGVVRLTPLGQVFSVGTGSEADPGPAQSPTNRRPTRGPIVERHPAGEGRVESDGKMTVTVKSFDPENPGAVS